MESLAHLGIALGRLRQLAGMSVDECAVRSQIDPAELRRAEEGFVGSHIVARLAAVFGIDETDLEAGLLEPARADGSTVFLLHGAYQDFDASDLGVLLTAIDSARLLSALDGGSRSSALRRRLQFAPVPVAGPNRRDAAQQGYKLARRVRAELDLGAEPIGDIVELLEDRLGIAVLVDTLASTNLRAASIVDVQRAAAAAVLAANDEDRNSHAILARVYLAHEAGHVLFDPAAPGKVRLALDDLANIGAPGGLAANVNALLESRAKGFAAEFLLPSAGLGKLFGQPQMLGDLTSAIAMAREAREKFGTPFEIAAWHLMNLGFTRRELMMGILASPRGLIEDPATRLPAAGAGSIRVHTLLAGKKAPNEASDERAARARQSGARIAAQMVDDLLHSASEAVGSKRVIAATDMLVHWLDEALAGGDTDGAKQLLAKMDPHRFPPPVLTGLLMVASHAPADFRAERTPLFQRVKDALKTSWGWDEAEVAALEARLG